MEVRQTKIRKVLEIGPALVTIVGGLSAAIAPWFIQITQTQFLQAILALLALIGTTLITERFFELKLIQNDVMKAREAVEEFREYGRKELEKGFDELIIRRRDLSPLEDRLVNARRISIFGGSLFRLTNEYKSLFEELLGKACELRFLLADPESKAIDVLANVFVYETSSVETYRAQAIASLRALEELQMAAEERCHIRLCSFAPSFSLMIIERGGADSIIQLEMYPIKMPARDRPTYIFNQIKAPKMFALYAEQFERAWREPHSKPHPDRA